MSTLGTMRARIEREMKRGDITASATCVVDAIVSAIAFFENRRYAFNEFHDQTFTASSSTTYVPVAQIGLTPIKLDTVKAVIGSRDYPLRERTFKQLDDIDAGQWYGYPDYYAWQGEALRLYPPPNDNYTIKISGYQKLTEISAAASAGASNAWMTDAEEMIRLKAKALLFRDELRNFDTAKMFEEAALRSLREAPFRKATTLTATGRIRPSSW